MEFIIDTETKVVVYVTDYVYVKDKHEYSYL